MTEHVDVLIVGAGLSGVGAAAHLKRERPGSSFLILESRGAVGGTWDLFRYPGVRSDSDMYTLGYSFRPWTDPKAIADGAAIRDYITGTIADEGLEPRIRLNHRVVSAAWSSDTARWTVSVQRTTGGEVTTATDAASADTVALTCSFLWVCSGYYRYDEGYRPALPGAGSFRGPIVHAQHWPADLDHAGKRVVIIGSGATAVTLVPAMAETAAHVTMLQRSPTYIAPVPSRDPLADRLRKRLPARLAYRLVRAKNIGYSMFTYRLSRRWPAAMKAILRRAAVAKLPAGFDVDTHLAPAYDPWDQRLCAIPDADLYRAISRGAADIVTGGIDRLTPGGVRLASGETVDADIIVTATGLNLLVIGGITLTVDGRPVDPALTLAYKSMMLSGVPNLALTIGYTNASWTLKADLVARYVGRLLRHMQRHGYDSVSPEPPPSAAATGLVPLIDLQSGYIRRSAAQLPKQGAKAPWRLHQNYVRDALLLRFGRLTDDVRFGHAREAADGVPDAALALPGTAIVCVAGRRIRYRRTGDGAPVLLLHGIGQSLEDWDEQHDRLADRHTVYSVDLPGFGYSERMPGPATLATLAGVLPGFLDAVGVAGPIPVVGNSLGGAVAMTFAAAHPDRVAALVLADSAGFGQEVTLGLRLLAIKPLSALLLHPGLKGSRRIVQGIFHDKAMATDARVAIAFTLAQRPAHAQTMLEVARDLGTFRGVREEWRTELVEAVAVLGIPTLVAWGDRDRILPALHLDAAADALPNAETHVFRDSGHMPQIEKPDEFASVVEGFLARHTVPETSRGLNTAAARYEQEGVGDAGRAE
ncbi:alpha/beta fold hydrolase [Cryobacterium tepidiphilum]|uniref:alpha/beta fold hydrolase n=1 Tax=Cryobacterium tepidiphilum TaxID=2486026 RepID=UPI00131412D3|nr:alpha/beta fold hydrolase [Cryobacterium tepidiphilum]